MARCKYCEKTIIWKRIADRWVPHDPGGAKHTCMADSRKDPLSGIVGPIDIPRPGEKSAEEVDLEKLKAQVTTMDVILQKTIQMLTGLVTHLGVTEAQIDTGFKTLMATRAITTSAVAASLTGGTTTISVSTAPEEKKPGIAVRAKPLKVEGAPEPGALLPPEAAEEFIKEARLTAAILPPVKDGTIDPVKVAEMISAIAEKSKAKSVRKKSAKESDDFDPPPGTPTT